MPTALPTITHEELQRILDQRKPVQVVNVLKQELYSEGSIRGSLKIPAAELEKRAPLELDKSKPVVTYCAGYECHASRKAAETLAAMGYDVKAYEGGIKEWKAAALPLDDSAHDRRDDRRLSRR